MENKDKQLTYGRTSIHGIHYHIIWCTKYRNKVLRGEIERSLKAILAEIAFENGYSIPHIEVGLDDHVHILVTAPPKISVSTIVSQLKGTSALRLFIRHPELKSHHWKVEGRSLWSPSYYVESIGTINKEAVAKYIEDQRKA
jgi:putative transposase